MTRKYYPQWLKGELIPISFRVDKTLLVSLDRLLNVLHLVDPESNKRYRLTRSDFIRIAVEALMSELQG